MNRLAFLLAEAALLAGLAAQTSPDAQNPAPQPQEPTMDLTDMSLEQLMEVAVEVGARHQESLASTAASVYVLNEPEIRRSGMRSIPDLLRLVPGLIIAQDVPGAFGFSSRLGEHNFSGMLVLIDGERLYATLLRREYWQAIDLPIENIERIEVVRGPGGARWGDKASQGVVNIVTKKAKNVAGLRTTGVIGTEERGTASVRFGGSLGEQTDYYLYAKMAERDGGWPGVSGDRWGADRVGMRVDTKLAENLEVTIDGDVHDSFLGDSYEVDPGFSSLNYIKGGHLKSRWRWTHEDNETTELRLAFEAYDQDIRDFQNNAFYEHLIWKEQLYSATLQHSMRLAAAHRLTLGDGVRQLDVDNLYVDADVAERYHDTRTDLFASWDWDLTENLRLTLGGNLGYVDGHRTVGVDMQPDVRLAWTPRPDFTIWTGLSANREPDQRIHDSGIVVKRRASNLLAYELGLRQRWDDEFLLQIDAFLYDDDREENGTTTDPGTGATLYETGGRTHAFGGEASLTWHPEKHWRFTSWIATTQANAQNFEPDEFTIEVEVPRTRAGLTIGWEPLPGLELDSNVLYTEKHAGVPSWWRLDLRVGYRISDQTSFSLVGQNLTDSHHQEYWYDEESQRGVYFMVSHQF
ncbi:MAG: TonB-dependent receptor [Planctomycetes bacterium]|nr:TonB-dependent receptor [Planctomycetota bacterium]